MSKYEILPFKGSEYAFVAHDEMGPMLIGNKQTMDLYNELIAEDGKKGLQKLGEPWESMPDVKVYHKSGKDDWGTPQKLYDLLNAEFGPFDLDVCASDVNAKAPIWLSPAQDALKTDWFGRTFMNPPYSRVGEFITQQCLQVQEGNVEVSVALVAARTDTKWFQMASMFASEIRFLKGRLKFEIYAKNVADADAADVATWAGLQETNYNSLTGVMTYTSDPAPFPSAVLIFDRSKTQRKVRFWDWQAGVETEYAFEMPVLALKGMESLPPELKNVLTGLEGLLGKYDAEKMIEQQKKEALQYAKAKAASIMEKLATNPYFNPQEAAKYLNDHPQKTVEDLVKFYDAKKLLEVQKTMLYGGGVGGGKTQKEKEKVVQELLMKGKEQDLLALIKSDPVKWLGEMTLQK